VPTAICNSQLRSGSAHWDLELAVEVRLCHWDLDCEEEAAGEEAEEEEKSSVKI